MALSYRLDRIAKSRRRRAAARPVRLHLEAMEDRTVPALATAVGTDLFPLAPGGNTYTQAGGSLYFLARQGHDFVGDVGLWRLDAGGTPQAVNAPALAGKSIREIVSANGAVFVTASAAADAPASPAHADTDVWKLDPNAPGGASNLTNLNDAQARDLHAADGLVFFTEANNHDHPSEGDTTNVWVTDGSAAGTKQLTSFSDDVGSLQFYAAQSAGGEIYFQFSGPNVELWASDGTTAGTHTVAVPQFSPYSLMAVGDTMYFAAHDDKSGSTQLWKAQGSQATEVTSFDPTPDGVKAIRQVGTDGSNLYFALSTENPSRGGPGTEIWISDGTPGGTRALDQPGQVPDRSSTEPLGSAVMGGDLYFTTSCDSAILKVTPDGGAAPIPLPAGVYGGGGGLTAVGDRIYFMANDGVHGPELWSSDGSNPATLVGDIDPGAGGSWVYGGPFTVGTSQYVFATDGTASVQPGAQATRLVQLPTAGQGQGATATTRVTTSDSTVAVGNSVTLTATVTPADPGKGVPTGQVVFSEGQVLGTAPLVNGTATLTVPLFAPGTHNLQAVYAGDGTFDESVSPTVAVTGTGRLSAAVAVTTSDATADAGQAVTFTATVTPTTSPAPAAGGQVRFFDGMNFIGAGYLVDGVASLQINMLSAGPHSITAFYAGDDVFPEVRSAPLTQTVNPSYTVGLTGPQASPTFGQPVALTAHVAADGGGSLPAGVTVQFRDGATPLGAAAVDANGNATLSVRGLGVGPHNITAVFTAGGDFTSDAVAVTVQKAATSAGLRSTAPTSRQGQAVTLTMTISPPATGMPAPTGTVTFKDGGKVVGSAPVANGRAALLVNNLAVGSHPVTATYQGDGNYTASSAGLTQTVTAATVATTTTVRPSVTSAVVGQQVALAAFVTPSVGTAKPVGSVTFKDGTKVLGATVIDPTGKALLLTSSLGLGTHPITATFGGAGIFASSTSAPVAVAVRLASKTGLTASASSIVATQGVTLTAAVGAAAGGAVQPAGSVTFYDGTKAIGTAPVVNGVARFTTAPITGVGVHRLSAAYNGSPLFAGSSSSAVFLNVRAAGTATTLLPPSGPAAATGLMTLNATVATVAPATGSPIGKVTFLDGSTALGSATVVGGKAALQVPKFAAGSHFLRAVFAGTGAYGGSSSALVRSTVAATTSTALWAPPAAFGQTTALKATVTALSPGFGKASGKVTFRDGTTVLGSATLLNGVATLGVKLGTGMHTLSASFDGAADFAASASAAIGYAVSKASPGVSFKASPAGPTAGTNVTVRAEVEPATAGAARPNGTVTLADSSAVLGTFALNGGPVIFQTTKLAKGAHALTARYSGDANYLPVTTNLTLTVA